MVEIAIIGGAIILIFALSADAGATVTIVTTVLTVRGMTWIAKKITQSINKDASEIINFAGWCIAGVSLINLISLSLRGIKPITDTLGVVGSAINGLAHGINGIVGFFDKIF